MDQLKVLWSHQTVMIFDRKLDKYWQEHEIKYNSKPIYSGYPIAKRSQEFISSHNPHEANVSMKVAILCVSLQVCVTWLGALGN